MKINNEIIKKLKKVGIDKDDGLTFLLSLYYELSPNYIPDNLKRRIVLTNILTITKDGYSWETPLFENQTTDYEWVITDYLKLYASYGMENKYKNECVARMQKLFKEYPELTKNEVLIATESYINHCVNTGTIAKYVKLPHNFIMKGRGAERSLPIVTWIEDVKEKKQDSLKDVL